MTYPASMAAEARELRDAGWSVREIHTIFERRGDRVPSLFTLYNWTDERRAQYAREQCRRVSSRRSAAGATFKLPSDTPEYRAAFMRELREARVPWSSIAKVHGVVFGERINEKTAKARVEEVST